jgi:pilus assembly protein FimV
VNHAKLRLSLAVTLALASGPLLALGLGQIEVKSKLSQPLIAEIPIVSTNADELESLSVSLASPDAFARVGLDRPNFLAANLVFSIGRNERGESVIRVTTDNKVDDPYLSFLIEADWGSGKLVREFSVLLDPPYLAPAPRAQVRTAIVAPSAGSTPAPAPRAQTGAVPDSAAGVAAGTVLPGPAASGQVSGGQFGPVASGQTLSQIASSLRPGDVGLNQMMVALLRANPEAFIDGNINQLKRGAILRIPGASELTSLSATEAAAIVREQTESWQQEREPQLQPVESTTATAAPAKGKPSAADARLRIVPPSGEAADASQSGVNAGGSGSELRAELSRSREEIAVRDAEIKDLRGRVDELEKLRGNSTQLIKLKDSELAALQKRLKDLQDAQAAAAAQAIKDAQLAAAAKAAETAPAPTAAADGAAETEPAKTADATEPAPAEPVATTPGKPVTAERPAAVASAPANVPAPPPPAPETPSLLSQPLVLGGAALLVVGLLSWLLMRGRGKPSPKSGAAAKRGSDAGALAASIDALRAKSDADEPSESGDQAAGDVHDRLRELRATVAARPDQLETHLALLRYHYAHGEAEAFADAASDMLPHVSDPDGPQWKEACALGRALCPGNSLFEPGAALAADDAYEPVSVDAPATTGGFTDVNEDTDEFAQALAELDPARQGHTEADSVWRDSEHVHSHEHAGHADREPADFEESQGGDAIATKLDLAQAYLDIGDGEAARALLDEVMAEGSESQRLRAQRLLSDIG